MKIAHISYEDGSGGAGRAAYRLHRALIDYGIESLMYVVKKTTNDPNVYVLNNSYEKKIARLHKDLAKNVIKLSTKNKGRPKSLGYFSSRLIQKAEKSGCDIINLHWVGNETVSINEISNANKPIVWTLHDMWAFCGTEHYVDDVMDARYRIGYTTENKSLDCQWVDIDRWVWNRKKTAWKNPFTIISPSKWLSGCAKQSKIFKNWPVKVIPNPLDTNFFNTYDKMLCRKILGLPLNIPLILFGAPGGSKTPRKGFDLLVKAIDHLKDSGQVVDANLVVVGQGRPTKEDNFGFPVHWMGRINDDRLLILLYNSTDVVVVPSRQENLPQSVTEAQACGTPVVGFNVTGLPDVVEHKSTGYLAEPYSTEDLARGIEWILEDSDRYNKLSVSARERAVRLWAPAVVVPQYLRIYEEATSSFS